MRTILVIELLGGIGDVLIALPAIQALGRAHPQAKLTVLTFSPGGDLLQHDPLIHTVMMIPPDQKQVPYAARNIVKALLDRAQFDLIVSDTTYDGIDALIEQSHALQVVSNLWRSPPPHQKVSDRFLYILQAEGLITPDDIAPAQLHLLPAEREAARHQLGAMTQPLVILYPDAGMAIKRWSTASFVQVGKALQQDYNATIVVPAGADVEQAAHIARAIGGTATVWPQGTLRELAALMANAALVIASDTGPARIAAALHTPTITLFGPSWHDRYGQPAPHINLQGYPDCSERNISNFTTQPCWYSGECPFDRWQTCLEDISPAQVLAAAAPFLQPSDSSNERSTSNLEPLNLDPHPLSFELGTPSLNLELSSSELHYSSLELHHSNLELEPSSFDLKRSSLELHHSNLELEPSSLELHHSTSELETPSLNPKQSSLETIPPSPLPTPHSLPPQWSLARNILVMRLDNIGDVLMTSPALSAIKDALPAARLTLMASPGGSQAATLLPWVDDVITCRALWQDLGKLAFDPDREASFIQTLRDRQFDAAIIFTSFSQTPHPAGLMCYLAGIPLRLGQSKEWGGSVLTTEVKAGLDTMHQVERNLRLIEAVGFPVNDRSLRLHIPESAQRSAATKLLEQGLKPHEPYIVINPWTSCQSRNYSTERFAIAAQKLAKQTGYRLVVTGVASDRAHSAPLLERLGSAAIDLIGQTSLAELAALIDQASLMVSNNTSTMHIADATRTPSVILFAGTEYECQWQPRHTAARLLRQPTDCSPCYAFTCPFNLECLDIAPEQVVEAGLTLLQTTIVYTNSGFVASPDRGTSPRPPATWGPNSPTPPE
ncbi:MAG: glycosyltransferase family 9 protein [Leptolyngbya sp. BL-A-14]